MEGPVEQQVADTTAVPSSACCVPSSYRSGAATFPFPVGNTPTNTTPTLGKQLKDGDNVRIMTTQAPELLRALFSRPNQPRAGDDSQLVLIACRNNSHGVTKMSCTSRSFKQVDGDEPSELVGSPLEWPFDPESSFACGNDAANATKAANLIIEPLTTREATDLLSKYLMSKSYTLPLYTLTDASDPGKTILKGVLKKDAKLSQIKGVLVKPREARKLDINRDLIKEMFGNQKVKCGAYAVYDVLGGNNDVSSKFQLEASWPNVKAILEHPPLGSKTQLHICSYPGELHSFLVAEWQELELLGSMVSLLDNNEVEWSLDEKTPLPLKEELLSLFDQPWTSAPHLDTSAVFEKFNISCRSSLDLGDKVWEIIKDCSSSAQLKDCLSVLVSEAQVGRVRAQMLPKQKCRLTELMTSCMKSSSPPAPLDDSQALELLVEMGLMKLQKDYFHIYTVGELLMAEHLQSLCEGKSSPKDALTCLKKLHHMLDMVILCKAFLGLPQNTLQDYSLHFLQYYKKNDLSFEHEFVLPIFSGHAGSLLGRLTLTAWRLTMESESNSLNTKVVCHFSRSLAHIPWISESDDLETSHMYHTTVLRCITSRSLI